MRDDTLKSLKESFNSLSEADKYVFTQYEERYLNSIFGGSSTFITLISNLVSCYQHLMKNKASNEKIMNLSNQVEILDKQFKSLQDELDKTKRENEELKKLISTYNGNLVQRAKVQNGQKIARKDNVEVGEIKKLLASGLSQDEVAEKLQCSRSTIWRRLKEAKS